MNWITALVAAALSSGNANADITGFTLPTSNAGFVAGGFSQFEAHGYRYGGSFDDHWLLTVDEPNPKLKFTITNTFNPRSGGGAVGFSVLTVTGPGVAGVWLSNVSPPCVVGFGDCTTRFTGIFAVSAGTYDLYAVGGSPTFGKYDVGVTVVPEPTTSTLTGAGVLLLLLLRKLRTTGDA